MWNKLSGNRVLSLHPRVIILVVFGFTAISLAFAGKSLLNGQDKLTLLSNQVKPVDDNIPAYSYLSSTTRPSQPTEYAKLTVEETADFAKPIISTPAGEQGEWITVRMRVTAYCPCRKCCGSNSDGYTASMHKIAWGDRFVAADKGLPFGTEMIIPGYNHSKPVKVMDRGRVIKNNRLDVFYNTHHTASQWGTQYLDVKVRIK